MIGAEREVDRVHAGDLSGTRGERGAHGDDGASLPRGRAQVGHAIRTPVGPDVQVTSVKGEDEGQPGPAGEAPRRESRHRRVTVDQRRARPGVARAPRRAGDQPVGTRPARLPWHAEIARANDTHSLVERRARGGRVAAPPRLEARQWPRRHRRRTGDGEVEPSSCQRPGLCLIEDPAHRLLVPRVRLDDPHRVGHGSGATTRGSSGGRASAVALTGVAPAEVTSRGRSSTAAPPRRAR